MKMINNRDNLRSWTMLLLILPLMAWGQKRTAYTEFGAGVGTLNQNSDIALNEGFEGVFDEIRVQGFIHAKRHFSDWFALGLNLKFGYTEAFDANHGKPNREFETWSTLMQSNLFFEIHFRKFGKYHRERKFTYYIKGGGGFAAWNPNLSTTSDKAFPADVIPQNDSYNGTNFLMGGGLKYRLNYNAILGLEYTAHFLNEDNLDGFLSTAGGENDGYGGISIYYSILLF